MRSVERRRFIRIFVDSPISFISSQGVLGVGELVTLSVRGLSFIAQDSISSGSQVRVSFSVGKDMTFELGAKVLHQTGKGSWRYYGIVFSDIDYRDLKEHDRLNEFILQAACQNNAWTRGSLKKRIREGRDH